MLRTCFKYKYALILVCGLFAFLGFVNCSLDTVRSVFIL